ncbi:MAG: hypothetical protein ABIG10_00790 [bacterium]
MNYKIAQLVVSSDQKSDTVSKVFISQPGADEENLLGRLFLLVEFKNKQAETVKLINFLIEQIKKNYYHNEQIVLLEKTASVKVENIFESAIAKLNQNIVEFLQTEKIKFSPVNINISIGVICKNELHFANLGRNKALLIYKPKSAADKKYDIMNVTKQTFDPTQEVFNINKLFSNIINGSIPIGGYFVFTNEALYEYLSEKQLVDIITTLPPAGAVEQIRNILQQTNVYVPFLGLIIKNGRPQDIAEPDPSPQIRAKQTAPKILEKQPSIQTEKKQSSLEALSLTEERTAQILNPIGFINFRKWKNIFSRIDLKKWKKAQSKNTLTFRDKLAIRRPAFSKIIGSVKLVIGLTANGSVFVFKTLTNKKRLKELKHSIVNKKKSLSKKQLITISILGIVLIAFVINLSYVKIKNQQIEEKQDYEQKITLIKQKQKEIETNKLYNNLKDARDNLIAISQLLENFPQKTEEQIKDYEKLLDEYNKEYDNLNNVTRLDSLEQLVSFEKEIKPENLALVNGQLYLSDSSSKAIYSVDINDPAPKTAIQGSGIKNLSMPIADDNHNIYYLTNNSIAIFDPSSKQLQIMSSDLLPANISAITVFNNRLYAFAPQDEQIYRYNRYGSSFGNKQDWLKQNELQEIKSMSIDGFIYILSENTVYQYGGGRKQNFTLEEINPIMDKPSKIIALKNYELLYIIEPTNDRLIVFNKNGKFLAQYTSNSFSNLIDFTVDESGQTIYLLDNNTIYQIPIWGT